MKGKLLGVQYKSGNQKKDPTKAWSGVVVEYQLLDTGTIYQGMLFPRRDQVNPNDLVETVNEIE